jgi:thiazole/oxazole-forming peptide maturase SagC family component
MDDDRELPSHPRLRPGIEIVTVGNDKILLRSFMGTVLLSGEFVASEMAALLGRLDGSRSLEDIEASVAAGFLPELDKFFDILLMKKMLVDADPRGGINEACAARSVNSHEEAYWSLFTSDAVATDQKLRASTVVVANLGGVGSTVARVLAQAGVGKLVLVDPNLVSRSDELFGYQTESIGRPRAEMLAAEMSMRKCENLSSIVASVDSASDYSSLVSDATLVVVASDNMSLSGYEKTNAACLKHGIRWISARIDRSQGIIGPFIVPRQTACFTCLELRARANADHPQEHEAVYRLWKSTDACPDDWPTTAPFVNIIGNYVALDVQRVLSGARPSVVLGRLLSIDLNTLETRFKNILKLPRCPVCSRTSERPLSKIWDIRKTQATDR